MYRSVQEVVIILIKYDYGFWWARDKELIGEQGVHEAKNEHRQKLVLSAKK